MLDVDRLRCGDCGDDLLPSEVRGHLLAEGRLMGDEGVPDAVRAALTDEDEIAHGEAVRGGDTRDPRTYEGVGVCAYCGDDWPCRTQRGIERLLARLAEVPLP